MYHENGATIAANSFDANNGFTKTLGIVMPDTMSEPDTVVSLQLSVRKRSRNRFKAVAADLDLDMSELGQLLVDWLGVVADDEQIPPALQQAIDKYKKARKPRPKSDD